MLQSAFALGLLAVTTMVACSDDAAPDQTPAPILETEGPSEQDAPLDEIEGPEPTARQPELGTRQYDNPQVQATYDVSFDSCKESGPEQSARDYGVSDSQDYDATAREHSELHVERGGHRDASYSGCYEGLVAHTRESND